MRVASRLRRLEPCRISRPKRIDDRLGGELPGSINHRDIEADDVLRKLVFRKLVLRKLVLRKLVLRKLVLRKLVFRKLVFTKPVFRKLVFRKLWTVVRCSRRVHPVLRSAGSHRAIR